MLWKGLLLIFCVAFAPSYAVIFCDYKYDANNLYTCNMLIFNLNGGLIDSISGNHLPDKTHADVVQVIAMGISPNVPLRICSSFESLERMELENLGINSLSNNPFQNCTHLSMLKLSNNDITTLLQNLFGNTILEELYLDNNKFSEVTSDLLDNLHYLTFLSFKSNKDTTFTGPAFSNLANLKHLDLSYCNFTQINRDWFENQGLAQLEILDLAGNLLEEIPANTFEGLNRLEVLALDYNQIHTIHEDSFIQPNLRALFLDSNKLEDLDENVFSNLQTLEILYLSENDCSNLSADIFQPLASLTTLGLHKSSIGTVNPSWFQSLTELKILLLEENEITEFPDRAFQGTNNIKFLSLYGNQLTKLNARSFDSLAALTHLDVRNNRINGIEYNLMVQSSEMKVLMFTNNQCADFDTISFDLYRGEVMQNLTNCFNNFDSTPFVLVTDNSEDFEWFSIRDGWRVIEFSVKAPENVHVGFTDSLTNPEAKLEIQFGENGNTLLQILERGEIKISNNMTDLLDLNEERTFRIHLGIGYITLYRNNQQFPFYGYFISQFFYTNFFGLRTQISPPSSTQYITWNVRRMQG